MPVDDIALRRVSPGGKIVNFVAMDTDETGSMIVSKCRFSLRFYFVGIPYAGVIPIEKALDPFGDAILAYEMNGTIEEKIQQVFELLYGRDPDHDDIAIGKSFLEAVGNESGMEHAWDQYSLALLSANEFMFVD